MSWKNPWFDPLQVHHRPDGFCNPDEGTRQPGDMQRWRRERKAANLPHPPQGGYPAFIERWWQKADLQHRDNGVWWLGHASLLLQLDGRRVLMDPVFSHRVSPVQFYGPSRKTPSPLSVADLDYLDAVVISHNHYDHLDAPTILALARRFPDARFYVPLGLKGWFMQRGINEERVTQLDWWQCQTVNGMTFTAVPARHWSMRTPWDRNHALWCGWVVESTAERFWFSGDTAYTPLLKTIPQRVGALTAAAIPIGAYAPRWFMHDHHIAPEDAVRVWIEIDRPLTIAIHWGVFELADDSLDMPPEELTRCLRERKEPEDSFVAYKIGQFVPFKPPGYI